MRIPFNKPYLSGNETRYIEQAVQSGKISGDGVFTKKCHAFFEQRYGFRKCLLTTSCTDALEMAAMLLNIREGDEVIMPTYTFVSTANAFVLRGAKIVFADSEPTTPNINADVIEPLITPRTKAIVVVHYAGMACDMDKIMALATANNLYVVEDAAQAIDGYYNGRPLGSIGHLAAFSFHETKNIIAGEGGMLVINDAAFCQRAEIIWEKGTNRSAFFRGEINQYGWLDIGSSFLPSDIIAAFLFAQLENIERIQHRRQSAWNRYYSGLHDLADAGKIRLPHLPDYATNNAHLFYAMCRNLEERNRLLDFLKEAGILAVFHYVPLHDSPFFRTRRDGRKFPHAERCASCLVRLPLYFELSDQDQAFIIRQVHAFYESNKTEPIISQSHEAAVQIG